MPSLVWPHLLIRILADSVVPVILADGLRDDHPARRSRSPCSCWIVTPSFLDEQHLLRLDAVMGNCP